VELNELFLELLCHSWLPGLRKSSLELGAETKKAKNFPHKREKVRPLWSELTRVNITRNVNFSEWREAHYPLGLSELKRT
jgi:hypothetical protein